MDFVPSLHAHERSRIGWSRDGDWKRSNAGINAQGKSTFAIGFGEHAPPWRDGDRGALYGTFVWICHNSMGN
jgi:hypothetical protein